MLITDAAVRETAVALVQNLGEGWALDTQAPADGAAHLIHGDGRAISIRAILGGTTAQLWITGNAAPTLLSGATPAEQATYEAHIAARLSEGRRYNKATTLLSEDDEDPDVIILRTLVDHLLPAFECKPRYVGHQPWIDLFDNALADVTSECGTASVPVEQIDEVEPEPDGEPGVQPEPESELEAKPQAEEGKQPEGAATEGKRKGAAAPVEEPESEVVHSDIDATDQASEPPAVATNRRPRKRTPKRRPKASTT
ncbi:hypothetical protein [Streptomyces melanogenes]|uniref:hypothetical protein n=1 Tax=Streptomyces melanogenes TaxID=67326 RepID=UPI00379DB8C0